MLLPDATQLVVTEAKLNSPLSGGTRNAPTYDQAARNVACIAELLSRADCRPADMHSLAFLVLAPQEHIKDGDIPEKLDKHSIERAVRTRAQAFSPDLDAWLEGWFIPALQAMTITPISWEQLLQDIASHDPLTAEPMTAFYEKCLKYNLIANRFVPA